MRHSNQSSSIIIRNYSHHVQLLLLQIYLQSNPSLKSTSGVAWKISGILFFVCFAISASITRVIDRRHHWWDVLGGDVFGITTALLMKVIINKQIAYKTQLKDLPLKRLFSKGCFKGGLGVYKRKSIFKWYGQKLAFWLQWRYKKFLASSLFSAAKDKLL